MRHGSCVADAAPAAMCRDFLLESLRATSNETTQHGAALGLGIAGLGSQDEEVFEDLKNVLYTDSAIAGEVRCRLEAIRKKPMSKTAAWQPDIGPGKQGAVSDTLLHRASRGARREVMRL